MSNKTTLMKILIIALLVLMSAVVVSCGKRKQGDEAVDEGQAKANSRRGRRGGGWQQGGRAEFVYSIAAETVTQKPISLVVTIGGDIQAKNSVSITPDTSGTLTRLLVYEGQRVRKGAIIAYVDPSKAGQIFKESPVRTPITGVVSSLPASIGNNVTAQQIIATVADNSDIELKIAIPEKYVGKVNNDTRGYLTVIAFPDERFPMKVKTLSSVLSTNTHTMPATMEFIEEDSRLKSGMYGSLSLILETKERAHVIRRDTILIRLVNNAAIQGVYLVKDKDSEKPSVYFSPVEIGIENNNFIEIISGIKDGDILVVQGQDSLSDGSLVKLYSLDGKTLITAEERINTDEKNTTGRKPKDEPEDE